MAERDLYPTCVSNGYNQYVATPFPQVKNQVRSSKSIELNWSLASLLVVRAASTYFQNRVSRAVFSFLNLGDIKSN